MKNFKRNPINKLAKSADEDLQLQNKILSISSGMIKKIFILLFIASALANLVGQNKRFIYEYSYISDTLNPVKTMDIIRLDIFNKKSISYGEKKFQSDSLKVENDKKGIADFSPPSEKMYSEIVIKNKGSDKLDFATYVANNKLIVNDEVKFNWKLLPNFSNILGFKVQQAETEFRGRKWLAWFSADLPIADGPYKFKGLPGLILKISDATKTHSFEVVAIQSFTPYNLPDIKDYSNKITVDYKSYEALYKKYRSNPVAHLMGRIPDYYDAEGNFVSGTAKLKEIEKIEKERLQKDNNMLEITLLKP